MPRILLVSLLLHLVGSAPPTDMELNYILLCQSNGAGAPLGAINDMYPADDFSWIVPSEIAVTGWALLQLGQNVAARNAGNYLALVQDERGFWADQYHGSRPTSKSHSTRSVVQPVMLLAALHARGLGHYGAELARAKAWLVSRLHPSGLVDGGEERAFWLSDNAYAVVAWHRLGEITKRDATVRAINRHFRAGDHWHAFIHEDFSPGDSPFGWVHFAPAMLDLRAFGVSYPTGLAARMRRELVVGSGPDAGAVLDNAGSRKRMPGIGFQASLAWRDLYAMDLVNNHRRWCEEVSGLWQTDPDVNGIRGGWVDWKDDKGKKAPTFQRFIDTSSYYLMVVHGLRFHSGIMEPTVTQQPLWLEAQASGQSGAAFRLPIGSPVSRVDATFPWVLLMAAAVVSGTLALAVMQRPCCKGGAAATLERGGQQDAGENNECLL